MIDSIAEFEPTLSPLAGISVLDSRIATWQDPEATPEARERAANSIYLENHDLVHELALKITGMSDLATEVAQESFIRAFKSLHNFEQRDEGTFRGWLSVITRNQAMSSLAALSNERKHVVYVAYPEAEASVNIPGDDDPAELYCDDETTEEITQLINDLSPRRRRILELRMAGLSYPEIAVEMEIVYGSARHLGERATKALKTAYQERYPFDSGLITT